MSSVELTVRFEWRPFGKVGLDQDRLVFPKPSLRPGLYSFLIDRDGDRSVYIGETDQLERRFQHYRTPGPSQRTNIRLNALMREALKHGADITVDIVSEGVLITSDGQEREADLAEKYVRVLLEHAAIYSARLAGAQVLNL